MPAGSAMGGSFRRAEIFSAISMRRSVVRTVRQPANVVAPLLFPMLLLAVNSGGLKAETRLPGATASIVLDVSHTGMLFSLPVAESVTRFFRSGGF